MTMADWDFFQQLFLTNHRVARGRKPAQAIKHPECVSVERRVRLKAGELIPQMFPLVVGSENSEVSNLVGVLMQPRSSRFL